MSYYYQVYTGAAQGRDLDAEKIISKLPESRYIDALIVGWSENMEVYRGLRDYTSQEGIKLWLWFPVFSEHSARGGFRQQVNIGTGEPFGAKVFDGDESFDFSCPSQKGLSDTLLRIYDDVYSAVEFDGVFLDRIRYPSMTMGLEALFGCGCEDCFAWFEAKGLSKEEIVECYERIQNRIKDVTCDNPLEIEGYQNGSYTFSDPALSRLLALRRERISDTVKSLADGFQKRGLLIGMDLFAPFLSVFVGQDYLKLGAMADFVKPMLYRYTYTPAGVYFELDAMAKALSGDDPHAFARRSGYLKNILGLYGDGSEFFRRELEAIKYFERQLGAEGRFIPGIELHTVKERPPVRREDICANVDALEKAGFNGRVACWDILCAEDQAIETFIFQGRGRT